MSSLVVGVERSTDALQQRNGYTYYVSADEWYSVRYTAGGNTYITHMHTWILALGVDGDTSKRLVHYGLPGLTLPRGYQRLAIHGVTLLCSSTNTPPTKMASV